MILIKAIGIAISEFGMTLGAFLAYSQKVTLSYIGFGLWILGIVIFMLGYKYPEKAESLVKEKRK